MFSHALAAYQPGLSPSEIHQALTELRAAERRTTWLLCRYLADLADDDRFRALGWFSDLRHYTRTRLGLGVKSTRERLRIGRALRSLPLTEQAFVEGRLGYSRVRELTRLARPEDEAAWVALAQRLSMRELERRVAGIVGAEAVCDEPAEVRWRTPETVELRLALPAETWALVARGLEGARQAAETPLSDAQALEAVALEALSSLAQASSTDIADPRKAVVLYQCRDCERVELETGAGAVPLSAVAAARLASGAKQVDLATEGRSEACVGGTMPAAIRRAVLARDRGRCRICGRRRYVDVHHFRLQSEGGEHSRENCGCACGTCHAAVHTGQIRIEGSAEGRLRWYDRAGNLLGSEEDAASEGAGGEALPFGQGAALLLRTMGGRGGWHADALALATGLSAAEVAVGLLELDLGGYVRQEGVGLYAPVGSDLGTRATLRPAEPRPLGYEPPAAPALCVARDSGAASEPPIGVWPTAHPPAKCANPALSGHQSRYVGPEFGFCALSRPMVADQVVELVSEERVVLGTRATLRPAGPRRHGARGGPGRRPRLGVRPGEAGSMESRLAAANGNSVRRPAGENPARPGRPPARAADNLALPRAGALPPEAQRFRRVGRPLGGPEDGREQCAGSSPPWRHTVDVPRKAIGPRLTAADGAGAPGEDAARVRHHRGTSGGCKPERPRQSAAWPSASDYARPRPRPAPAPAPCTTRSSP